MRVRAQDANGDMTFGDGGANFLVNSPDAVAQLTGTRLRMNTGEWFLDVTDGMPWMTQVLGAHTGSTYDRAIRARILGTQGVGAIVSYSSAKAGRALSVTAAVETTYGAASIVVVL